MNYINKYNMIETPSPIKAQDLLSEKTPGSEVVAPKSKRQMIKELPKKVVEGVATVVSSEKRRNLERQKDEIARQRERDLRDYEAGLILLESFDLIVNNPQFVRKDLTGGGYSLTSENPQKKHPEDTKEEPEVIEFRVVLEDGKYDVSITRISTSADDTNNHRYRFSTDDIRWKIDTRGRLTPETGTPVSIAPEDQIEFLSAYTERVPNMGDYLHCRTDALRSFAAWDASAIRNHFEKIKSGIPPLDIPPTK